MGWLARIFGRREDTAHGRPAQVFFTNTLTNTKELFIAQRPGIVTMYSCGPTVYGQQHIGNMRAAVFSDTIARVLKAAHYHVRRVTNITDVGHMVGDNDEGEDKMAVGARQEKLTPEAVAARYTKMFLDDLDELNIDADDIHFPRATEYIKEQIALAKTLEEKGFAYYLPDGLYFDTQKFPSYGQLGGISNVRLEAGARVEVAKGKRHSADFVLWRTAKLNDLQQWDSPWGRGNPGWHIECSAMIRSLLGQEIDIHTGGEEHVSIMRLHNPRLRTAERSCTTGCIMLTSRWVARKSRNLLVTSCISRILSLKGSTHSHSAISSCRHTIAHRFLSRGAHLPVRRARSNDYRVWHAMSRKNQNAKMLPLKREIIFLWRCETTSRHRKH